jgi:hypothetical protein
MEPSKKERVPTGGKDRKETGLSPAGVMPVALCTGVQIADRWSFEYVPAKLKLNENKYT